MATLTPCPRFEPGTMQTAAEPLHHAVHICGPNHNLRRDAAAFIVPAILVAVALVVIATLTIGAVR